MTTGRLVIGLDFGTDSVRTVIVDADTGAEVASAVRSFSRWSEGRYCDPAANRFRQHPLDHLEGLEATVREALAAAPPGTAERIAGITVDTTGSTPGPVDRAGVSLALLPEFDDDPDAMFVLWKDHTAVGEAEEINQVARSWGGEDVTKYVGGVYSSEWFWSKILHILRGNPRVREAAFSWVEHCDWVTAVLTGTTDPLTMKRSRCAAGHKAMWHASFGGLPPEDFLTSVDPLLAGLRERLYTETWTCDVAAGTLAPEWAERLGLQTDVVVGVGAFDAHLGAIGGQIQPYVLCKVMGTSTCDMLVAPLDEMGDKLVRGICGQVDGSILPGMLGMEAGQSAFGDVYAWFRDLLAWPLEHLGKAADVGDEALHGIADRIIPALSEAAAALPPDATGVVALDWLNGRRTPFADQALKGALAGLSLGSHAPRIFRALVEATAFGAKKIVDRFQVEGVPIHGVIALGGVPKKAPFVMQTVCDVLEMPIRVACAGQTCALGSAMAAATAAGLHADIPASQAAMGSGFETEYRPDPARAASYRQLYERYEQLGRFVEERFTIRGP
ncbi:MAG: ribulokinase [Gemmatimonadetes bacterium]|nr:ribulokinase [Gemmatimonadota bacterium]NIO31297.1 ribulokinase [Gemmatimonadota bacterium]